MAPLYQDVEFTVQIEYDMSSRVKVVTRDILRANVLKSQEYKMGIVDRKVVECNFECIILY